LGSYLGVAGTFLANCREVAEELLEDCLEGTEE